MSKPIKQIHLAAHFPGVNNTTVWSDPAAGSHIEFSSFAQFAQTAERGKFDFLFLAEGLRLRPATLPHDLVQITEGLVPELRRRGLFRTAYEADTLRGLLGLGRPANRYAIA